jgi:hypothetical protein
MATQQKLKAMREQQARKKDFYKKKREANPASKDYVKPDKSSTDKPKPKTKTKTTDKPKTKTKTTAKTTPKPTGISAVSKSGMLARGVSAVAKGAKSRGLWGIAGGLGAFAITEALRFDPKVAGEQWKKLLSYRSGDDVKLSAKQRMGAPWKTPKVSKDKFRGLKPENKVTPPLAGSTGKPKVKTISVTKPVTQQPKPIQQKVSLSKEPKADVAAAVKLVAERKDVSRFPKASKRDSSRSTGQVRITDPNLEPFHKTTYPTKGKNNIEKNFLKFMQDSSRGDRHLGAPKKKPLGMEDAFWDGSSWVR